jgi:chemotaxis protein histidine kinase CheA
MSEMKEGCDNFGSCSAETFLKGGMSIYISEELNRQMVNAAKDLAQRAVLKCGEHYNFDGSEAIRLLGLSNVKVERQKPVTEKKVKEVVSKAAFPLPYNGELNEAYCFALRQNNGLYTQCQTARKEGKEFCKGCQVLAEKNGGIPEYGTIQQRNAVGVFEYTDPKGRKPVSYTKVMKKYKVSEEQVQAEAGKLGMKINEGHFVVPEADSKRGRPKVVVEKVAEPKGPKGRPKKTKKVLEIAGDEHEDLFAAMVANAQEEVADEESEKEAQQAKEKEELVKEKAEKEAQRLKEKEELAKQKAAEKAEKEAKLVAEKAEKAAKLAAEKEEKESKKKAAEEEKALKKAAFDEAKALKKAALEEKKSKKEGPKESKKKAVKPKEEAKQEPKQEEPKQDEAKQEEPKQEEPKQEEEDTISGKEKMVDGKMYIISKARLVYDHHEWTVNGETVVIGKWNKDEKKIEFTPESDGEESEEEYDE